ncbi:TPA: type II 3-dehydroquinate dehydratase [bacterium]|nr:type II 3-dehydroquinate dehydratase [bacterium]
MSLKILVIHGPNLNLLGKREPSIYGLQTLTEINQDIEDLAKKLDVELKIIQSNSEGIIVSFIGDNAEWADGIIINPAAYTHTSVAIRDAISGTGLPAIEVHLSNVFRREEFRHFSYISPVAIGVICGLGPEGYLLALNAIVKELNKRKYIQ